MKKGDGKEKIAILRESGWGKDDRLRSKEVDRRSPGRPSKGIK